MFITEEQLEILIEEERFNRRSFNELLEEYTGIKSVPYTSFYYEDSLGNWVGDSNDDDIRTLLDRAYIEVKHGK